jgi:hypothetical protein
MKHILVLGFFILVAMTAANTSTIVRGKMVVADYGRITNSPARAVTIDAKDNIFAGGIGINIVKFSPSGQRLWQVKLGTQQDNVDALATDKAGNVLVLAVTYGSPSTRSLVKLDAGGKQLWRLQLPNGWNTCNYLALDAQGNAYLASFVPDSTSFVGRVESTGKLGWNRTVKTLPASPGDYLEDDGYTYAYLGVRGDRAVFVIPYVERGAVMEFMTNDGRYVSQTYRSFSESNDPAAAKDSRSRKYEIRNTGRWVGG